MQHNTYQDGQLCQVIIQECLETFVTAALASQPLLVDKAACCYQDTCVVPAGKIQ